LNYQLESIDKELKKSKEDKSQDIINLKKQIEVMNAEREYNFRKYNKLNVFKIETDIEAKQQELEKLETSLDTIPSDVKFKIYSTKDDINITEREIEYFENKKKKDLERIARNIKKAELERNDLINRSDIKSPVEGLVANMIYDVY
jgi:multidrug resistance efflux pump